MKYSDRFVDLLVEQGYTTVFYVAGGNIMHLLNSCRSRLRCIPMVHEVSAVIAAEYFNESTSERAFALVTAGPGLTNCVTGIAGAWLESRGVLIVGGQVKSTDLMRNSGVRQNGIQELNGVEIVKSICKSAICVDEPLSDGVLEEALARIFSDRAGPVFLEFCLDVQALEVEDNPIGRIQSESPKNCLDSDLLLKELTHRLSESQRPLILIGGGVSRDLAIAYVELFEALGIPIMTTWNGADRIPADHPLYFGRPNTWGQRSSNIILQQADLLLAIGTRLGLQQTGFNWQEFMPLGKIIQVDIDASELHKLHPQVDLRVHSNASDFISILAEVEISNKEKFADWVAFSRKIRDLLPLNDVENSFHEGFLNPYEFVDSLSNAAAANSVIVPCSSGGAFTTMMQAFNQKSGQVIITNKGLASMGYGLAGAIGAAIGNPDKPIVLVEGDGGFAQNLQEIGTATANGLRMKIFIYVNEGYASIRMTQRNYFDGAYMGCDVSTGLGLPNWEHIFKAYGMPCKSIDLDYMGSMAFASEMADDKCRAYLVPVHPEQTYFPKITSSISSNGQMVSNPIHLMTPPLKSSMANQVFRYS